MKSITLQRLRVVVSIIGITTLLAGCAAAVVGGATVGALALQDQRTTGTQINDEEIEWKVLVAVLDDEQIRTNSHVNATSFNGVVLLTGETTSESLRSQIESIANKVAEVREVYNEIIVAAPSSLGSRSNDSWITGKVKTKLFEALGDKALQVKVVTERSTVFLMGLVSAQLGTDAAEAARRVGGVQRVIKVFEYIPSNTQAAR
jgi:osmotically-inducible protein OsmY